MLVVALWVIVPVLLLAGLLVLYYRTGGRGAPKHETTPGTIEGAILEDQWRRSPDSFP